MGSSYEDLHQRKLPAIHVLYGMYGTFFMFFEGRVVNAKIKTGRNSHAPVFHMQVGVVSWHLNANITTAKISSECSLVILRKNVHPLNVHPLKCAPSKCAPSKCAPSKMCTL